MWVQTLCVLSFILVAQSKEVTFSSKCKLDDSECLRKTTQDFIPTFTAGIPEIGLEVLDPLHIDEVDASNNVLNFKTRNITIIGFRNTKVEEINIDKAITTLSLKALVSLDYTSDYEVSGNLLVLPIEGKGPMTIKIPKLQVVASVNILKKTENGKTYFTSTYKDHSYKLLSKSDVKLGNLFSGNKALATAAEEMVAQSGNEVITSVGDPIIRAVIDSIIVRINELLKSFQADDLYIH